MEICPKKAFFALKLAKNPKDQLGPHSMTKIIFSSYRDKKTLW